MPNAWVHINDKAAYRKGAFINGLSRLGYIVNQGQPARPMQEGDVAVIWNKMKRSQRTVDMATPANAAVIVIENGYWGKDAAGIQTYAMALDGHNGSGRWYAPDDSRLKDLDIQFKPFRPEEGDEVLVADQRGIGSELMRSPPMFGDHMADHLRREGWKPQVRRHPGANPPVTTLREDLEGKRALVVWSSNCATHALIEGVPTYYAAPTIVTAPAARAFSPHLNLGTYDHLRYDAFSRMAWAQWFLSEISSGEALRTLIDVHAGRLPSYKPGFGL